jgi:predicted metal-dependent hydrolase
LLKPALLRIGGNAVEVHIKLNPRARRLIVKVHPVTGEVSVVAPSRAGLARALDFAARQEDWIVAQRAHVPRPVRLGPGVVLPLRGQNHTVRACEISSAPVRIESGTIYVAGRPEHAPRRLLDFLKRQARQGLEARVQDYAPLLDVRPSRITVRDTVSRWGSCSAARGLSFSWRLILAPDFVLDYVVAHEVAHLREMNHGLRFWRHVEKLVGDPRRARKWLREHGADLQRYSI